MLKRGALVGIMLAILGIAVLPAVSYSTGASKPHARCAKASKSKGKRAGHLLTRARILLKADVSEAGDGWSDSRIAEALDTSIATIERTRRQLVEEGFEAVLTRKSNPNSAPRRIFDGAAEAKLIALACGPAPAGHAKWTLRLLEEKVVELQIVESASDNTIGRTLKKTFSSPISSSNG